MALYEETIAALHKKLIDGSLSAMELTESILERIAQLNDRLNAFITVMPEHARTLAQAADKRLRTGSAHPLCGIPIAVKDIFTTKGIRTTCGSRMLHNFVPPFESTVTQKLLDAGAVIIGKANMDEFAMGSSNETSYYGPCRNPWDQSCVTGGSSGGSACAVAARLAIAAVGTDTGGSIRQPAAFCGVVGLKPTYGRVSRYGLVAYASSLDQAGPLTQTVEDCALLLQAIAGYDQHDSTCADIPVPEFLHNRPESLKGVTVGIPKEYFVEGIDPEVRLRVMEAILTLEALGATIVEMSLPHTRYAIPVYYLIATAEASSNLARYDGVKYGYRAQGPFKSLLEMYEKTRAEGFGEEVKRRIMLGTYALSAGYYDAYYRKAQQVRTLICQDFSRVFEQCKVIVTPTSPTPAFKIGEKIGDPLQMYLMDIYTISANLAGLPGLSLPCGITSQGLPVGLQILGRPFAEEDVLEVAWVYEQHTGHWKLRPSLL